MCWSEEETTVVLPNSRVPSEPKTAIGMMVVIEKPKDHLLLIFLEIFSRLLTLNFSFHANTWKRHDSRTMKINDLHLMRTLYLDHEHSKKQHSFQTSKSSWFFPPTSGFFLLVTRVKPSSSIIFPLAVGEIFPGRQRRQRATLWQQGQKTTWWPCFCFPAGGNPAFEIFATMPF